jgi:hypothetical protein
MVGMVNDVEPDRGATCAIKDCSEPAVGSYVFDSTFRKPQSHAAPPAVAMCERHRRTFFGHAG